MVIGFEGIRLDRFARKLAARSPLILARNLHSYGFLQRPRRGGARRFAGARVDSQRER